MTGELGTKQFGAMLINRGLLGNIYAALKRFLIMDIEASKIDIAFGDDNNK